MGKCDNICSIQSQTSGCQLEIILDIRAQPSKSDNKSGPHGLHGSAVHIQMFGKGFASYLHANIALVMDGPTELDLAAGVNPKVLI